MKNKRFQREIESSKRYLKTRNKYTHPEHQINHWYVIEDCPITWWTDIQIKCGSQMLTIWYIHPRCRYTDIVDEESHQIFGDFLVPRIESHNQKNRILQYINFEENQRKVSDLIAIPSWRIQQLTWARGLDICIPIELVTEDLIIEFALKCKELVLRRITWQDMLSFYNVPEEYKYTREDWKQEQPLREECQRIRKLTFDAAMPE